MYNAHETALAISDEFFQVGDEVRISLRGLARLIGTDEKTIRNYVTRFKVRTLEVEKGLEGGRGKDAKVRTLTLSLTDASQCIVFYAVVNKTVSQAVKYKASQVLAAFATLGIQTWVKDILGLSVDTTAANATINELLELYPGLKHLTEQTEGHEGYLACHQYLHMIKGHPYGTSTYQWYSRRLGNLAAANYKALKQERPRTIPVMDKRGCLVPANIYLFQDLRILDMAYDHLTATRP